MKAESGDHIFEALSDPHRRRLLELVRTEPGVSATELAARFPFSRVAVIKHLRILERGGLLTRARVGKSVGLYVDDEPLRETLARELERCAPWWTQRLIDLKETLEREAPPMTSLLKHVYVVYIR